MAAADRMTWRSSMLFRRAVQSAPIRERMLIAENSSVNVASLPSSVRSGALLYSTGIPLRTPADDFAAKSQFLRWVWYASRRAGLHLDEAEDEFATTERLQTSLRIIAPTLRLNHDDQVQLLPRARLTRYGADGICILTPFNGRALSGYAPALSHSERAKQDDERRTRHTRDAF